MNESALANDVSALESRAAALRAHVAGLEKAPKPSLGSALLDGIARGFAIGMFAFFAVMLLLIVYAMFTMPAPIVR